MGKGLVRIYLQQFVFARKAMSMALATAHPGRPLPAEAFGLLLYLGQAESRPGSRFAIARFAEPLAGADYRPRPGHPRVCSRADAGLDFSRPMASRRTTGHNQSYGGSIV